MEISAAISRFLLPIHAPIPLSILAVSAARPAVRSDTYRTAPRSFLRRSRRTRRRPVAEDGGDESFSGDGDGDDGPFGGGGGGGGWGSGSGGNEGFDWEESRPYSWDPAFDLAYEMMCWIALFNCAHFAFKKLSTAPIGRASIR